MLFSVKEHDVRESKIDNNMYSRIKANTVDVVIIFLIIGLSEHFSFILCNLIQGVRCFCDRHKTNKLLNFSRKPAKFLK